MKRILLSVTAVLFFSSAGYAAQQGTVSPAVISALDAMSGAGDNRQGWNSSLGEIENTTAVLVDLNTKISREYQSLNARLQGIQSEISEQQKKNSRLEAMIQERREALDAPDDGRPEKVQSDKELETLRALVTSVKARLNAADSRIALRKLKVQELELEKRLLLRDSQSHSDASLNILRQSVQSQKDRVAAQKGQALYVQQKMNDLMSIDRPYLKEANGYARANMALKTDLTRITARRDELGGQLNLLLEKKNQLSAEPDAKRAQAVFARKQAQDACIVTLQERKAVLQAQAKGHAITEADLTARIKDISEENQRLEAALGNTRENIAVLEYRINTLTRYKNRNVQKN